MRNDEAIQSVCAPKRCLLQLRTMPFVVNWTAACRNMDRRLTEI
jgi:hypothetical protein